MLLEESFKKYDVILASNSPRRQELLRGMGVAFRIMTQNAPESFPDTLEPAMVPQYLSKQKSLAFDSTSLPENFLLITADTVVICQNKIFGKPKNHLEATEMLKQLSGKKHLVVTGVTVRSKEKTISFSSESWVSFAVLDPDEIAYYVDHYKPFDKAGAYGIQEWIGHIGIDGMEGSFYNVMGLPTHRLYQVLKTF